MKSEIVEDAKAQRQRDKLLLLWKRTNQNETLMLTGAMTRAVGGFQCVYKIRAT